MGLICQGVLYCVHTGIYIHLRKGEVYSDVTKSILLPDSSHSNLVLSGTPTRSFRYSPAWVT